MVIGNIVKHAKIASTNRASDISLTIASLGALTGVVAPVTDGKVDSLDAVLMAAAVSVVVIGGTVVYKMGQMIYRSVEETCENSGFTESVMRRDGLRRKAKIYATESGRMDEYELAFEDYQIQQAIEKF